MIIYFDTINYHPSTSFHVLTSRPAFDNEFGDYLHIDTVIQHSTFSDLKTEVKFQFSLPNYSDSTELLVPFDNDGGYLILSNLGAATHDTIHFENWTVYSNCFRDSIFETIEFYKRNPDDTLGRPFKMTQNVKTKKKTCMKPAPSNTTIKINHQLYMVSVQKRPCLTGNYVRHRHGYNRDINKPFPKTKKLTYRHTIRETKKYGNFIIVRL